MGRPKGSKNGERKKRKCGSQGQATKKMREELAAPPMPRYEDFKKKRGRPKSTLDSLPDGWENDILQLYQQGACDEEIKGLIGYMRGEHFSEDLWQRWLKEEPKFSKTIEEGRRYSYIWWKQQGRKNLSARQFQTGLYCWSMGARFGEGDTKTIKHTGKIETDPQTIIINGKEITF